MVLPENAGGPLRTDTFRMLMTDQHAEYTETGQRQRHFLQRNARNPFRLLRYLRKKPPGLVIFNDFEQLTAPAWAPMFRKLAGQHTYGVILHDPDRDAYPPSRAYSERCMKAMMQLMDIGLYHQLLPDKPYYKPNGRTKYFDVPHGLYPSAPADVLLLAAIAQEKKEGLVYAAILGNIRPEKNYELAIRALKHFPNLGLLIAGKASNSAVNVNAYRSLAAELEVEDRIIWVERFLTDAEMTAAITAADILLLYYARSFTSQSGILNTAAPLRKTVIASSGESSLAHTLMRFSVGVMAAPDSLEQLCLAIARALEGFGPDQQDWSNYLAYASWDNHVSVVMQGLMEQPVSL
jgi:hypothetical protein